MENQNILITCRRCGRKTLIKDMKMDMNGIDMICLDCYRKQHPEKKPLFSKEQDEQSVKNTPYHTTEKKGSEPKLIITAKQKAAAKPSMIRYYCTACKYKFSRKSDMTVVNCPYCGKPRVQPDTNFNADVLIKDSMDRKYDF